MKELMKDINEYVSAWKNGLVSFDELIEMVEYIESHPMFIWTDVFEDFHNFLVTVDTILNN